MSNSIKPILLLLALLVMLTVPVFSQNSGSLSLDDCIQIALQNNSLLKNAEWNVKQAQANKTIAKSAFLPTINSSFSSGKYIQGARTLKMDVPTGEIDPATGGIIYEQKDIYQSRTERNSHSASISLYQNIFDFGRSFNGMKQANAREKAIKYSLVNTRNLVIANVMSSYYNLHKTYKLLEVQQQAVTVAKEQVNRVQTMMDIGLASQAEVFQAKVTLGIYQTAFLNQKNSIEFAKADLNNALGRYPTAELKIDKNVDGPLFPDYDFAQAQDLAKENNQELKSWEQQVRAAELSVKIANGAFLPRIGAAVSYSRQNDNISRVYDANLDEDYSATVGAQMNLDIFNGFSNKAQVQLQSIAFQKTLENYKERERLLFTEVNQYFLALEALKGIIEINKTNIEAYEENLRLQTERRRVGSGTELEVSEAQSSLISAQTELVNAESDAKIAKANLEAILGIIEKK